MRRKMLSLILGLDLFGTAGCSKATPVTTTQPTLAQPTATADSASASSAAPAAAGPPDFAMDGVPTLVTVSGPPDHVRFLLKNRAALSRRVKLMGLDYVDVSGARLAQQVGSVGLEGRAAIGPEFALAPREEILLTVSFTSSVSPSAAAYRFVLYLQVDGVPIEGQANVARAQREPWRR